jgi:hypothetical protein
MSGLKLRRICPSSLVVLVITASSVSALLNSAQPGGRPTLETLHAAFLHPADDARIMMRWWWFGSAVTKPELERELRVMKSAGVGGIEIQPVYPVALDDPKTGFRNLPYGSGEFLDAVRFTAAKAAELGMRVDITLGSGWPYGGPDTPVTEAAGRLRIERAAIPEEARVASIPALENGEKLMAVFLAADNVASHTSPTLQLKNIQDGKVQLPARPPGPQTLLFFISSRTGQQVKRPAIGAEGFVLDHYDRAAITHHLAAVGNPLLEAFGAHPPHAVFSDSLEVFGTDWTSDFLDEFRRRRGYELTPHLPALAGDMGEETPAIRHDWGETLTELAEERYLTPIREWAHAHHTLFRSQTYGEPPVVLSSNALVDLPEGEHGPEWRTFGDARWASSASHLYGRPVTSSETWTWLHAPSFRATPLDMKAEADLHFIQGINQLVGHGWPYSPPAAEEPGWRFYASAAFNEHNPWFHVMPEITRYLQRVSFLLRQGAPANDVAIYLPTDDAWAHFKPEAASVDRAMDSLLGPNLIPQVLNAGFNFDFIDDRAIAALGIHYRVLILPGVERMPLETLQKLGPFMRSGGHVVATRRLPSQAPGFLEAHTQSAQIAELTGRLFAGSQAHARFLPDEQTLGSTLAEMITPDFATGAAAPAIGFLHRKLAEADVYFIVNTSNHPVDAQASIRVADAGGEWWDAFTGQAKPAVAQANGKTTTVSLELAPYESRVLVFSKGTSPVHPSAPLAKTMAIDLSPDWKVTFAGVNRTIQMDRLRSWTDDEQTRYYSGEAIYEKVVNVPSSFLRNETKVSLNFGPGELVAPAAAGAPGMRALLESPVRESALIYVNSEQADAVWHPPYVVDVTRFVRPGANHLRIVVANLATNEMAGRALPDYRLLNLRYGARFQPQGFENLKPVPAGILGKVELRFDK